MSWRDRAFDVAAAGSAATISVLLVRSSAWPTVAGPGPVHPVLEPAGGAMLAGQLALSAALLARRRFPVSIAWLMVAATAVLAVVEGLAPGSLVFADPGSRAMPWLPAAAPFAAYSATAHAGKRWIGLIPVAVLIVLGAHGWDTPPDSPWTLQSLLFIGGPALLALYFDARRRLVRSLRDRAERAEREQQLLAEQARAEERSRLAGEMHDVVTHRVSLMVLQAGALRVTATDPATRRGGRGAARAPAARRWTSCATCVGVLRTSTRGARRRRRRTSPRLVRGVGRRRDPGRAGRGRRPGAAVADRAPHGVPHRAGVADERAQARAGPPRHRARALRPRAASG